VDEQEGLPLYMAIHFVDFSTCEPVPDVFFDFWSCNSTGIYSGVSATANGNSNTVTSSLNKSFLRGVQKTDLNGAVQFKSVFPGKRRNW